MAKDGKENATGIPAGEEGTGINRRDFIRGSTVVLAGAAATAAALSPLVRAEAVPTGEELLQQHYRRLSDEEKERIFRRIEGEVQREYGVSATVGDPKPLDGVQFVYILNVGRCIGCRKCVHACVAENNQSRSPEIQYIRVLEMPRGSIDVEKRDHHYDPKATKDNPIWMTVDVEFVEKFPEIVPLETLKPTPKLDGLLVIKRGQRLSIQPVDPAHFKIIRALGRKQQKA